MAQDPLRKLPQRQERLNNQMFQNTSTSANHPGLLGGVNLVEFLFLKREEVNECETMR